jgi:hypothetical protein
MRRVGILALLAACSEPATLTEVQAEVFTPSCAFSTCHGGGATGGLDLTEGSAYGSLVDQPVADVEGEGGVEGEIRVIPGDSENSYLMKKLRGDDDIAGDPMPPPSGGLDEELIARVASWIDDGAQNN